MVKWFIDRVLPGLFGGLVTVIAFSLWGHAGSVANDVITRAVNSWFPPHAVMFVANEAEGGCPQQPGWVEVGTVYLPRDETADRPFKNNLTATTLTTMVDGNGEPQITLSAAVVVLCRRN